MTTCGRDVTTLNGRTAKIHSRNVYASTSEECEAKLAELIRQMKAEIAEVKELTAQGKMDEAMALANGKKPRGTRKRNSANISQTQQQ